MWRARGEERAASGSARGSDQLYSEVELTKEGEGTFAFGALKLRGLIRRCGDGLDEWRMSRLGTKRQ